MSVTKEVIDAECKLVIRVTGASLAKKENLEAILTDLNQALTALEEEMASSRHYFFQISLEVDGVAPKAGAFNPYETAEGTIEPNDPWCSFCPEFWDKALSEPELRLDVKKFVKRFNSILRKVVKTAHSPPSELDEVQLGEPLLAHLALTDLDFVPLYLGFLRIWDADHEVEIAEAVDKILARHGYCEEVEELLAYCLLEVNFASGPNDRFLRTFRDIHPGASNTILFRRFIVESYRKHLTSVAENYRVYQSRLRSEEEDTSLSVPDEFYRYMFEKRSAFGTVEHRIIAELQASHKVPSRWSIGSLFGK